MNTPVIPGRCRQVFACLAGHVERPRYVRMTGKWRNIDLIQVTGRNSADVRLRELVRLNPGVINSEVIPGSKCGAMRFWIDSPKPRPAVAGAAPVPSLFDY